MRRAFLSYPFWLTIVAIVVMNYLSVSVEMTASRGYTAMYLFSTFCLSGDYLVVILFLGTIPYGKSFITDWNTQFLRFHLIRSSTDGYTWSKVITVFTSSFLSVFLGFALTLALFSTHLPFLDANFNTSVLPSFVAYADLASQSIFLVIAAQVFALSIGVAVWSVCALLISAYITNAFVALSAPVILYYVVINSVGRILPIELKMDRFMLGNYSLGNPLSTLMYTIMYCLLLAFLMGLVFNKRVRRRIDHG